MKRQLKQLTNKEIQILKRYFDTYRFQIEFNLVYEAQIPHIALVLLNGIATLQEKRKKIGEVPPGTLLGLHQVLTNSPSKQGLRLASGAEVVLILKSQLMEVLNNKRSEAYQILKMAF